MNRMESQDFHRWSNGELVLAADKQDSEGAQIYSMSVFPYEGVYVGLVQMYYSLADQQNLEVQLAISRDGREFTRVKPRDVFIPEARIGEWDRFNISIGDMPPVVVGDELWFYYSGRAYRHPGYEGKDSSRGQVRGFIGLATIKHSRFVSLEASFDGGIVMTRPLILEGKQLFLNANTRFGIIDVKVLDERGTNIKGLESTISGRDGLDIPVQFKQGSLSHSKRTVRIQFTLKNAELFGFHVK